MKPLALSSDLQLPVDIAAQTIGLVGIRGSGKTNTAGVIADKGPIALTPGARR